MHFDSLCCKAINIFRKVYFNARFDDVMLMVKCEMACVLRGPFPAPVRGYTLFISLILPYFAHYTRPGKLDIGHMYFSFMANNLLFNSVEGNGFNVCLLT